MRRIRRILGFIVFIYFNLVFAFEEVGESCSYLFNGNLQSYEKHIRQNISSYKTGYEKLKYFLSLNKDKIFRYKTRDLPVKRTSKGEDQGPSVIYPPSTSVVGIDIKYDKLDSITSSSVIKLFEKVSRRTQERDVLSEMYDVLIYLKEYDHPFYTQVISDIRNIVYEDPLQISGNLVQKYSDSTSSGYYMNRLSVVSLFPRIKEVQEVKDLINTIVEKIDTLSFFEYLESKGNNVKDKKIDIKNLSFSFNIAISFLYYEYYYSQTHNKKCSAIVVSHNVLITAAHCVSMVDHVFFSRNGQRYESETQEYNPLYDRAYIVIGRDSDQTSAHDIGVVIFPDNTFSGIPVARVARKKISSSEGLVITGYNPLSRVFAAQKVGRKSTAKGRKVYISQDTMRIIPGPYDLRSEHGNSGSPVFNEQDELVALLVSGRKEHGIHGNNKDVDIYVKIEENLEYLLSICKQYGCKITGLN